MGPSREAGEYSEPEEMLVVVRERRKHENKCHTASVNPALDIWLLLHLLGGSLQVLAVQITACWDVLTHSSDAAAGNLTQSAAESQKSSQIQHEFVAFK